MAPPSADRDQEVETQIMLLESAFGDGPHQRERERAAAWLLAHPERSFSRLLALLEEGRAGAAVVELLPRFERTASIPLLARLLTGPEHTAWSAGQALARHSDRAAGEALRQALASANPEVIIIALDALAARGDPNDCAALVSAIGAPEARVRYHAVQAAGALGCLARSTLESMARVDPSADVRDLATRLLNQH